MIDHTKELKPDRRFHGRRTETVRCKVMHTPSLRFAPGQTRNLSESGALLELDLPRPLSRGEEVRIAFQRSAGGIVGGDDLVFARVVRAAPFGEGRQLVAVEFAPLGEAIAA
jgi:hypothetical protein